MARVTLRGEKDSECASTLRRALLEVLADPRAREVVVDLRALDFCDSSGLNALLEARLVAVGQGQSLRLVAPSHQVVRLFQLTGADSVFAINGT
ncbi:STAS domain-containing protein [Streptomyces goshikiensis]|uniref:STAS domain-containing protein n=1 Tax=Streptomyces goshikiensis TaxID=1942 RepID=UPI0036A9A079